MPLPPPTPQGLLGPFYFGVILGTFLYGILVVQAITYYQSFKHDKTWLRCFVGYLFFVETVSTAMSIATIYEPLVAQFNTDKPMRLFPTLLPSQPFLEVAVFVPVQFFYAWRISVIMRNYWVPALICVTSLTSMVGAIWSGIIVAQVKVYAEKPKIDQKALLWSCSAAGADAVITAALMLSLTPQDGHQAHGRHDQHYCAARRPNRAPHHRLHTPQRPPLRLHVKLNPKLRLRLRPPETLLERADQHVQRARRADGRGRRAPRKRALLRRRHGEPEQQTYDVREPHAPALAFACGVGTYEAECRKKSTSSARSTSRWTRPTRLRGATGTTCSGW
ncbi:hypothetical protein DFH06DRAFT_1213194, partial [Mycena polygramma]